MDAIEKTKGPCVILAGAGTGKTYTILEKAKYLIENGIYAPERIICITFSNEAANNLVLRMQRLLGLEEKQPVIRTFHGFSSDLLRKYGEKIGISNNFKILDPEQAMVILHRSLKVVPLLCKKYIETISVAKDLGILLSDFEEYLKKETSEYSGINLEKRMENLNFELQTLHLKKAWNDKKSLLTEIMRIRKIIDIKKFVNIWGAYEKLKHKGNYQDYADLNKNALILLKDFPEIALEFSYFIVDEFQDTNKLQLDLLICLAQGKNITIVGDMNQSIYRFRGAYKDNLRLFKEAFSVVQEDIFNLDRSYRSPNSVLRIAHKLILNNYENPLDCFFVDNAYGREGEKVTVLELSDAKEEARKIVEIIKEENRNGLPLEEICVMYRAHHYSRIIKRFLEQEGIPYHAVAKSSLLKQASVKSVFDYLIILNKLKKKEKGGEQAWWDLAYQMHFQQNDLIVIGKEIKQFVKGNIGSRDNKGGESRAETKEGYEVLSVYLLNNIEKLMLSESGKIAARCLIERIRLMLPFVDMNISELLPEVYRIAGFYSGQATKEEEEIVANLSRLHEMAKMHEELYDSDLDNFLYYVEILQRLGIDIEAAQLEEKGVRLMSAHAAKGLEYSVVILSNFVQGRFPIVRYAGNLLIPTDLLPEVGKKVMHLDREEKESFLADYERRNQLLEERRLAYVSFTRAKDKLYITYADDYNDKKSFPSQFLHEIAFDKNNDILFVRDLEKKYDDNEKEIKKELSFSNIVNAQNFEVLLEEMTAAEDRKKELQHQKFSPSALLLFVECQKEFEYKYVYHMPERKTVSWEAMRLGSFVHTVLERGVKSGFNNAGDFLQLAREIGMNEEWEGVSLLEAETLIRVFFERNKGKYNADSMTEQYLSLQLAGIDFVGYADRIDVTPEGVEIIDYKTGKTVVTPLDRNWQLGFYALAAKQKFGKVRKVVLDMLKQDRPIEFEINEKGDASCVSSKFVGGFNIYEVEEELIETARKIQEAYKKGFQACPIEKNCEFCNEYVWGL